MINKSEKIKVSDILGNPEIAKREIIEKFNSVNEIKYFNECWNYLMEIISKGSTKKSDLHKYKFKKAIVYFMLFIVPFSFFVIIFLIVLLLPYLVSGFVWSGFWIFLALAILIFSGFAIFWPLFALWRDYVISRQVHKFNLHQIFLFENKKILLNFDVQVLISSYKDSSFYVILKWYSVFFEWKDGKNKTWIQCILKRIFDYFTIIKNELNKGSSFLDAYIEGMKVLKGRYESFVKENEIDFD